MDTQTNTPLQSAKNQKQALKRMLLASFGVALVLTLIESSLKPVGRDIATGIGGVIGYALAFMFVPMLVLGLVHLMDLAFKKSKSDMATGLWVVWILVAGATSISIVLAALR